MYSTTPVRTNSLLMTLNCANHVVQNITTTPGTLSKPAISDIKDWMTENNSKCRQNRNNAVQFLKTQASTCTSFVLPSHHFFLRLSQEPWFLPIQGFSMKEHTNFICKTAFLQIRNIGTIRHYLTDDTTQTLLVSLVLSRIDHCNSLLAGLPQSLVGKL